MVRLALTRDSASKWWLNADGTLGRDQLPLNAYTLDSFEFERDLERERAALDREDLELTHRQEGLESSMRKAEVMAVTNHDLDPAREDGRLFRDGPEDRFTTLREAELAGRELEAVGPECDEWQELLDRANDDKPDPEPTYWLLHHQPVETPYGEPLGTALVMIEFPQLTPDFGAYLEEHGMDDSIYPTEARRVEVAHFTDEEVSRKFEAEFREYLIPGMLGGPELAPEVARLDGLSGLWEPLSYWDIVEHLKGDRAIVKESIDWHLHNSHSELDVRTQFDLNASADIDL